MHRHAAAPAELALALLLALVIIAGAAAAVALLSRPEQPGPPVAERADANDVIAAAIRITREAASGGR